MYIRKIKPMLIMVLICMFVMSVGCLFLLSVSAAEEALDIRDRMQDMTLENATNVSEDSLELAASSADWFSVNFKTENKDSLLRFNVVRPADTAEFSLFLCARSVSASRYYNDRGGYYIEFRIKENSFYYFPFAIYEEGGAAVNVLTESGGNAGGETTGRLNVATIEYGVVTRDGKPVVILNVWNAETGEQVLEFSAADSHEGADNAYGGKMLRIVAAGHTDFAGKTLLLRSSKGVDEAIVPSYEPIKIEELAADHESVAITNAENISDKQEIKLKNTTANAGDWMGVSFPVENVSGVYSLRYRIEDPNLPLNLAVRYTAADHYNRDDYRATVYFSATAVYLYAFDANGIAPVLGSQLNTTFAAGDVVRIDFGVVENAEDNCAFMVFRLGKYGTEDVSLQYTCSVYKAVQKKAVQPQEYFRIYWEPTQESGEVSGIEKAIFALPEIPGYEATDIASVVGEAVYSNAKNVSLENIELEANDAAQGWMGISFGGKAEDRDRVYQFRYTKEAGSYAMFLAARSDAASQWYDGQKQYMAEFAFRDGETAVFVKKIDGTGSDMSNASAVALADKGGMDLTEGEEILITFGVKTNADGQPVVFLKVEKGTEVLADIAVTDTDAGAEEQIGGTYMRIVASTAQSPELKGVQGDISPIPEYTTVNIEDVCAEEDIEIFNAQNMSERNELELRRKGGEPYGIAMPMGSEADVIRMRLEVNDSNAQIRIAVRSAESGAMIRGDDYQSVILLNANAVYVYNRTKAENPSFEDVAEAGYPISRALSEGEIVTVEFGCFDLADGKSVLVFFLYDAKNETLAGGYCETDTIAKAEGQYFRIFFLAETDVSVMGVNDTIYENFVPQPFEGGITQITDRQESDVYNADDIMNAEEFVGKYGYKNFINMYAKKLENGDVELLRMSSAGDRMGMVKIAPKGISGNYAIRFKMEYTGSPISIAIESMADLENGNTWTKDTNFYTEISVGESISRFVQYYDGFTFAGGYEFKTEEGEFEVPDIGEFLYVEFGVYRNVNGDGTLCIYARVFTEDASMDRYIETQFTGSYAKDFDSWVKIYNIHGGSDVVISGVKAGLLSMYEFEISLADGFVVREDGTFDFAAKDIGELVPIGQNGVVYTKGEDAQDKSQSVINFADLQTNPVIKFKLSFTGENFGAIFAIRARSGWDTDGYFVKLQNDMVVLTNAPALGTVQQPFAFEAGRTYLIEIGCIDFYYVEEGSVSPDGVFLYIKIDGTTAASAYMDNNVAIKTGSVFSGRIEGEAGSSLTILPVEVAGKKPEIKISAQRNEVAVNKTLRLQYENSMPTLFDEVAFEIVKGDKYAKVNSNGMLSGLRNGTVRLRAVITNEYGTFYSNEFEVKVGTGKDFTGVIVGCSIGGAGLWMCWKTVSLYLILHFPILHRRGRVLPMSAAISGCA